MPITCSVSVRPVDQEEFARLDYRVMRHAYDSHNKLGRLCDEVIYQNDLAARLQAGGFGPVRTEVPIEVTYADFAKRYRLDLVVEDAVIYELKTATGLVPDHDAQVLNYLFLYGVSHGKLINFRPPQLDARFVNTTLTAQGRREFVADTQRWQEPDSASQTLRARLLELLGDWGGFLELDLYVEALVHFLGGEAKVLQPVPLMRDGVRLGNQRLHLLDGDSAFRLTALAGEMEGYERQLQSLLRLSPLRSIQWINLGRHRVQFVTLQK